MLSSFSEAEKSRFVIREFVMSLSRLFRDWPQLGGRFGRTFLFWFLLLGLCLSFVGCQTRPSLEDLGELEFAVPDLPGLNDPYPIPGGSKTPGQPADKPSSVQEP